MKYATFKINDVKVNITSTKLFISIIGNQKSTKPTDPSYVGTVIISI